MDAVNVFISSSFHEDFSLGFQKERDALKSAMVKNRYLNDISLDYGDPQIRGSVDESLARVADAKLIILFIGTRYGGIVEGEDISLTHLEYRKAIECDIPVLTYIFPKDPTHEAYAKTDAFIKEIEDNKKQIHSKAIEGLSSKYENMIPGYKAGYIPVSEAVEDDLNLYARELALEIVSKINEELHKLQKKLPFGVEEIKEVKNETSKYKLYLSNEKLPYISRTEFKKEYNVPDDFKTDEDFYNDLFVENKYDGVLISGEGGVGKTRLMFELARKVQKKGWKSYQIFSYFRGWDTLTLKKNEKYCFIIDYVEENKYFENDIVEILNRQYPEVIIKVIANARSSYLLNADIKHERLGTIDLELDNEMEKAYLEYVVYNVFKSNGIDLDDSKYENLKELSRKPSFAVFLLQGLLKTGATDFHEFDGFPEYIAKRFTLTMESDTFSTIDENVFKVLCTLPMKEEILSEVIDESLVLPLHHDGWIEYDETQDIYKSAYNDTIMDEILIQYFDKQVFKKELKLKKELISIFNFAIKYGKFEHAFRAFDRIIDKSLVLNQKKVMLERIFENYIDHIKINFNLFLHSSLVDNYEKLEMIIRHNIIEISSKEFSVVLARSMANNNLTADQKKSIHLIFNEWLNVNNNVNWLDDEGKYMIPVYLRFFGSDEFILSKINNFIEYKKNYKNLDFILIALLEYTDKWSIFHEEILSRIAKYLKWYYKKQRDQIINQLIHVCTDTEGNVNIQNMKYMLHDHISSNFDLKDQQLLVKIFAKHEHGNFQLFNEKTMRKFIENDTNYKRIVKFDILSVEELRTNILNTPYSVLSLSSIEDYFKKNGKIVDIENYLIEWMDYWSAYTNMRKYFKIYLENGGKIKKIEIIMKNWINKHKEEEIYNIIKTYLIYKGNPFLIRESLEYQILYKEKVSDLAISYLNSGGNFVFIKDLIELAIKSDDIKLKQKELLLAAYIKKSKSISQTLLIESKIFKDEYTIIHLIIYNYDNNDIKRKLLNFLGGRMKLEKFIIDINNTVLEKNLHVY